MFTHRFLLNRTIFLAVRQAFTRIHLGFFQVWGKCCSILFNTRWCIGKCIPLDLIWVFLHIMADVKPYILFLIIILTDVNVKVADVMATYLADVIAIVVWDGVITHILICIVMLLSGICNCQEFLTVVDVKTTFRTSMYNGWCYCHCGWCYYQYFAVGMCYHGSWCYYYLLLIDWLMLLPMWLMLLQPIL